MIKTINNVLIDSEEIQVFDKRLTVCPVCGKEFLPNDLGSYCYKQINNFKRVRPEIPLALDGGMNGV